MAYPPYHWTWIHPVQVFQHNKSSSAAGCTLLWMAWMYPRSVTGWVSHSQCILQLMMTYIETPGLGVSMLSDGVSKPFPVRPAADDDLLCWNAWIGWCIHVQWWAGYKPFTVCPAADDDLSKDCFYIQQMTFICSINDFYMFNEGFLYSFNM